MINTHFQLKSLLSGKIRRKKGKRRILNCFLVLYIILTNYDKPFLNPKDLYIEQPFHLFIFCSRVQHSLQDPSWSLSNFSVNNFAIADWLWNWIIFLQGIHVIPLQFANAFFLLYPLWHTCTGSDAPSLPQGYSADCSFPSSLPPQVLLPAQLGLGKSLIPRSSGQHRFKFGDLGLYS